MEENRNKPSRPKIFSEEDIPKRPRLFDDSDRSERPSLFGEEDRSSTPKIFDASEKGRLCRYCRHYVVNPFVQRCMLHRKMVEATDTCEQFQAVVPLGEQTSS